MSLVSLELPLWCSSQPLVVNCSVNVLGQFEFLNSSKMLMYLCGVIDISVIMYVVVEQDFYDLYNRIRMFDSITLPCVYVYSVLY